MAEKDKLINKKHLARIERERIQNRYLIIGISIVVLLVVGVIGYGFLDLNVLQPAKPVAQIGSDLITTSDFQSHVRYARWKMIQQYRNLEQYSQMYGQFSTGGGDYFTNMMQQIQTELTDTKTVGSNVLDQMINDTITRQQAAIMGISVSEDEVTKKVQEFFSFYPNGTAVPSITPTIHYTSTFSPTQLAIVTLTPTATEFPTPTMEPSPTNAPATPTLSVSPTPAMTETPYPTSTPYTEEGFQKLFKTFSEELTASRITEADMRINFREQLLQEKMQEKLTANMSPEEEQVWARHILVADEAAAKDVLKRLENKEDWVKIAAEVSKDTSNKDKGGDLGWFGKGKMVADFEKATYALKIGEISQPVKTDFGYHIIQALGHEVRQLDATQLSEAKSKKFNEWLTKIKGEISDSEVRHMGKSHSD